MKKPATRQFIKTPGRTYGKNITATALQHSPEARRSLPILRRLRTLLQHLAIPDRSLAGITGKLEVLG